MTAPPAQLPNGTGHGVHGGSPISQSTARELTTVGVLALGFGLVGIDRYLISTLFPVIARDLHLGYGDIGTISGALSMAWGIAALIAGNLSDRVGRRRVLVIALVAFALLIGASGLAAGLAGLVAVRIVMGFADGAFTPASISATLEASRPAHRGRNIGIQQLTLTLFGLGFAPLLVAALLKVVSWRWIFSLFVLPAMLLAWATWRVVPARNPRLGLPEIGVVPADASAASQTSREPQHSSMWADWRAALRYSNVRLLMVAMLCWLTCLVTTSALLPSYLLDHLHLNYVSMSRLMSAIGFGAMAGTLLLPWLSDRVGRRPVMLAGAAGAGLSLLWLGSLPGTSPTALFASLFCVHAFNNALITLTVGPLCAETVPARLMATASGLIIAVGELFGGGLAPMIAGRVAERFGIAEILWLPTGAMVVGLLLCFGLRETRAAAQPTRLLEPGQTAIDK